MTALLKPTEAHRLLERVMYEHLLELVDLEGLIHVENMLIVEVANIIDDSDDCERATKIAMALIHDAWRKIVETCAQPTWPNCDLCEEEAVHRSGAG